MSEARLIELESRVAFQEESIRSLSDTLQSQQRVIDELRFTLEELRQRLKAINLSPLDGDHPEPQPPHY